MELWKQKTLRGIRARDLPFGSFGYINTYAKKKESSCFQNRFYEAVQALEQILRKQECAISKKDFLSKIYIALKECSETLYWLELLTETDYLSEQEFKSLNADCDELRRMLSATTKTISSAQQK